MATFPDDVMAIPVERTKRGGSLYATARLGDEVYECCCVPPAHYPEVQLDMLEHQVRIRLMWELGHPVMRVVDGEHKPVRKGPDGDTIPA
jgi:hypothetical protein